MGFADTQGVSATGSCPEGCNAPQRSHGNTNNPDAEEASGRVDMSQSVYELLECEGCGHRYVYSYASGKVIRGGADEGGSD